MQKIAFACRFSLCCNLPPMRPSRRPTEESSSCAGDDLNITPRAERILADGRQFPCPSAFGGEPSGAIELGCRCYFCQNGFWISLNASKRVIPMSSRSRSLRLSSSYRDMMRRHHSPDNSFNFAPAPQAVGWEGYSAKRYGGHGLLPKSRPAMPLPRR
jgi:hypothetical protein